MVRAGAASAVRATAVVCRLAAAGVPPPQRTRATKRAPAATRRKTRARRRTSGRRREARRRHVAVDAHRRLLPGGAVHGRRIREGLERRGCQVVVRQAAACPGRRLNCAAHRRRGAERGCCSGGAPNAAAVPPAAARRTWTPPPAPPAPARTPRGGRAAALRTRAAGRCSSAGAKVNSAGLRGHWRAEGLRGGGRRRVKRGRGGSAERQGLALRGGAEGAAAAPVGGERTRPRPALRARRGAAEGASDAPAASAPHAAAASGGGAERYRIGRRCAECSRGRVRRGVNAAAGPGWSAGAKVNSVCSSTGWSSGAGANAAAARGGAPNAPAASVDGAPVSPRASGRLNAGHRRRPMRLRVPSSSKRIRGSERSHLLQTPPVATRPGGCPASRLFPQSRRTFRDGLLLGLRPARRTPAFYRAVTGRRPRRGRSPARHVLHGGQRAPRLCRLLRRLRDAGCWEAFSMFDGRGRL